MQFVGIDLAWSEHHPSGVAVIDSQGTVLKADSRLKTNSEIIQCAGLDSSEGAVVAIDAPLVVRNATGCRPVEKELTDLLWGYETGPYPANLSNPAFQEGGRIRQLAQYLEGQGFTNQPTIPKQADQRSFLEVFPGPALVILFPAVNRYGHFHAQGLRYKHKAARSWSQVHTEWEIYRAQLRSLEGREPSITLSDEVRNQLGIDITHYLGSSYKQWDDLLDGILCAYLAYWFWYWGEAGYRVVGSTTAGCVTLPRCQVDRCPMLARPIPGT